MRTVILLIASLFLSANVISQTNTDKAQAPDLQDLAHFKERPDPSRLKSTQDFPFRYDLRDYGLVTSVKRNRISSPTAFAVLGAIESRWLVTGFGEYDLSEQNMITCHGHSFDYTDNFNRLVAGGYLNRLDGPVLETYDPYDTIDRTCYSHFDLPAYVPEMRLLPADPDVIKKTIMDYGAVYTTAYYNNDFFNSSFNTYYCPESHGWNNPGLIVGWDDNKTTAGGVGVWIIKDCWGESWAEDGFYYCSYQDANILQNNCHFPVRWDTSTIDKIYLHNDLGWGNNYGKGSSIAYGLTKFIAPGPELLTRIGTNINTEGTIIDIEIYDDFDGNNLNNLLTSKLNVFIEYPGYSTFEMPVMVNDDFYIKIRYFTPGYNFPLPVETQRDGSGAMDPLIKTGVNWSSGDGSVWGSLDPEGDFYGDNLTIRAYTVVSSAPRALFESSNEKVCLASNVTFTYLDNNTATTFQWDFGENASPATAITKGPHQVSYSTEGRKTISLIVIGPGGNDTLVRDDYIDVVSQIEILLPETEITVPVNSSYTISAFGADSYSWSPSQFLDNTTSQTVTITPTSMGDFNYTVTGYQGSCSNSAGLLVHARERPPNDSVCNAIELSLTGFIGTFDNVLGTVEENEPHPPFGECEAFGSWCDTILHNSVWFWFTAPVHGMISFDSEGMDNKMALYEANTCADILIDNYTFITANDDFPGKQDYAAALECKGLTPGQKYFVQVDGSYGGVEDTFDLYFWDHLFIDGGLSYTKEDLNCPGTNDGSIDLSPVYGQAPYSFYWSNGETTEDISGLSPGEYVVTVIDALDSVVVDVITIGEPEPLITEITDSTNVSFEGAADGDATVTPSGGTPPYEYLWDDNAATIDGQATGLYANIWYHVVVTDANGCTATDSVRLTEMPRLFADIIDSTDLLCFGGNNGSATVTAWGGKEPYNYLWDNPAGSTTTSATGMSASHWYHVTVTDQSGQTVRDSVLLTEPDPLTVEKNYSNKICEGANNGYVNLDVSGGTPPYHYSWSNGASTASITGLGPGEYQASIGDAHNCYTDESATISEISTYQDAEICMITVNNNNRIMVVWEKTYNQGISAYNIYREQSAKDNYVKIGTVPFDDLSIFVDDSSLPQDYAHFYKISITDSCGNESELSEHHKSIYLQTNLGLSNEVNLNWDEYEGFEYFKYEIYRGSELNSLFSILTISSSNRSWSDNNPPSGINYYRIKVDKPEPCFPTQFKADDYSSPFSNYDEETIVGIYVPGEPGISVYPNPFTSEAAITFPNPENHEYKMVLMDISGRIVRKSGNILSGNFLLDRKDLPVGIYIIELKGEKVYRSKIVIE
jgi:C1A family cysteine protease/PKD repeat protein